MNRNEWCILCSQSEQQHVLVKPSLDSLHHRISKAKLLFCSIQLFITSQVPHPIHLSWCLRRNPWFFHFSEFSSSASPTGFTSKISQVLLFLLSHVPHLSYHHFLPGLLEKSFSPVFLCLLCHHLVHFIDDSHSDHNYLCFSFLMCKMDIVIAPTVWGSCDGYTDNKSEALRTVPDPIDCCPHN